MSGTSLAIGLTCVGIGLPMIVGEAGFWDHFGLVLLVSGVALTWLGIWRQGNRASESPAARAGRGAVAVGGPAVANPQASRDIHLGDTYNFGAAQQDKGRGSMNRAIANALTELNAIRLRLLEATKTQRLIFLPADHHQPLADLLADQGLAGSRRILDDAYNACDHLQHRLEDPDRGWDGAPIPETIEPRINEEDDLPGVLQRVETAIAELRRLQEQLPD